MSYEDPYSVHYDPDRQHREMLEEQRERFQVWEIYPKPKKHEDTCTKVERRIACEECRYPASEACYLNEQEWAKDNGEPIPEVVEDGTCSHDWTGDGNGHLTCKHCDETYDVWKGLKK